MVETIPENLQRAVEHLYKGGIVLLLDDPERENEGDLVLAAEYATPGRVHDLLRDSSRKICVSMTEQRLKSLELPPVVRQPTNPSACKFHTPVDARDEKYTGLGAEDRAAAIFALLHDTVSVYHPDSNLDVPGHTDTLRADSGGVLARQGHTEGSLELMALAGLKPMAAIVEVWDGSAMLSGPMKGKAKLEAFARNRGFPKVYINELAEYRRMQGY
tara:strand:+ start:104598 stop:105245 length:648 start_codon:yes stop_codon:yes gene_type:complete